MSTQSIAKRLIQTLPHEHFVGGAYFRGTGLRDAFVPRAPYDGTPLKNTVNGCSRDVDEAVLSAAKAFQGWKDSYASQRATLLDRISRELRSRKQDLAQIESLNTGKPIHESIADVEDAAQAFSYCAELASTQHFNKPTHIDSYDPSLSCSLAYVPIGPTAAITPWNFPIMMAAWKIAPALAAGCTVVVKPSELTPYTTLELARIIHECGAPHGAVNVLLGDKDTGMNLVKHSAVAKVSFTGSLVGGQSVMRTAAERICPVVLELGGKSPAIVLADADISETVKWLVLGSCMNAGQVCSATSRVLVEASIADDLISRLRAAFANLTLGYPFDEGTDMGPLISQTHRCKVAQFVNGAIEQGAKVVCGGAACNRLNPGNFYQPTVLSGVTPDMHIFQEEVFGPVLTVTPFENDEEAIDLANNSRYGLAAAIFGTSEDRLARISNNVVAGTIWTNCSQPMPLQLPWGGCKFSGIGREMGMQALASFLQPKSHVVHGS